MSQIENQTSEGSDVGEEGSSETHQEQETQSAPGDTFDDDVRTVDTSQRQTQRVGF